MAPQIPLGRFAGIKVTTDLTVPALAAVYTVFLAQRRFPIEHPGLSTTVYWVAGVTGALLFFVSLLVHEFGHALVAREEGIGVRGVSLWLLGGMARLESSPTSAGSEFKIAVVGPLASAACGVTFLSISYVLADTGVPGLIGGLCHLLGVINIVLAVFNLIPAAPLDGGTVLASAIWKRTGSQVKGMRVSSIVGIVVGLLMIWRGSRIAFDGGPSSIDGWSFLAVGLFIVFAALQSLRAQPLYALLEGSIVADAVEPAPVARGWVTVDDFLRGLPDGTTAQSYPVIDERGLASGLLTAEAIRSAGHETWDLLRVDELAFPLDRITTVRVDEPLLAAVQRVDGGEIRDGLVVDGHGTVVGVIDSRALFRTAERRRDERRATELVGDR